MKKIHFDDAICSIFIPPQNDEVYWIYILSLSYFISDSIYFHPSYIVLCFYVDSSTHTFSWQWYQSFKLFYTHFNPFTTFYSHQIEFNSPTFFYSIFYFCSVINLLSICLRMLETFFSGVICVEAVFLSRSRLNFLKKARNDVWKFN